MSSLFLNVTDSLYIWNDTISKTELIIETTEINHRDISIYLEYCSAIIPWLIAIHNIIWCIYFFYKFGCCRRSYGYISRGMKRSAGLVFIIHAISPIYMGGSNFFVFIDFIKNNNYFTYSCSVDFIILTLLYGFCQFSLFLFFTFRVDVIFRDSHFGYNALKSWFLRILSFLIYIAFSIYLSFEITAVLDDDSDFCLLNNKSYKSLFISASANFLLFLFVIIVFARKICLVTNQTSVLRSNSNYINTTVNNESYKLIDILQYHTLLIVLNSLISMILLVISINNRISAITLSLAIFCDIWCLLLMFRRIWFKKYCNYCLKITHPCWRICCGINRPQYYHQNLDEYNNNRHSSAHIQNGGIQNDDYFYNNNTTNNNQVISSNNTKKTGGFWSKFSIKSKKQKQNNDLYVALVDNDYSNDDDNDNDGSLL